ncbi:hypothetical protein [Allorhizocola rhizosphaerae]|nr:hypothetical protein [Allorhizocola rhizosphaerae]
MARHAGYRILECDALTTLAGIYRDLGDDARSAAHAREALALRHETG